MPGTQVRSAEIWVWLAFVFLEEHDATLVAFAWNGFDPYSRDKAVPGPFFHFIAGD
jgi:hypothetical protein